MNSIFIIFLVQKLILLNIEVNSTFPKMSTNDKPLALPLEGFWDNASVSVDRIVDQTAVLRG
jgi:hypothetical protein